MFKFKKALSAIAGAALAAISLGFGATPAQAGANNCGNLQVSPIHSTTFYYDDDNSFDAAYIGYSIKNNAATTATKRSLVINSVTGGTISLATGESATRNVGDIAAGATKYVYFLLKASGTNSDPTDTNISVSVKSSTGTLCTITDTLIGKTDALDTEASRIDTVTIDPVGGTVEEGTNVTVTVVGFSGNIGGGENDDDHAIILSPVTISSTFDPAHYRLIDVEYESDKGGCLLKDKLAWTGLGAACEDEYTATYVFETLANEDQTTASTIQGESYIASGANIKHPEADPVELPLVLASQKIVYKGNGATEGSMSPTTGAGGINVDENAFSWPCHKFAGFNTKADGKGTAYEKDDEYTGAGTLTLYAQWDIDESCTPEELAATGSDSGLMIAGLAALVAGFVLVRRQVKA